MHELHEWNLALGRALMGDIAHFELALRNTYDRVLTERFEGGDHWLFDANSPVTRPIMRKSKAKKLRDVNLVNRRAVGDARGRAHDPANPDQVVAGLMLGFWAHMTDRSSERDLWIPYLHAAWPARTDGGEAQPEARSHQQAAQPRGAQRAPVQSRTRRVLAHESLCGHARFAPIPIAGSSRKHLRQQREDDGRKVHRRPSGANRCEAVTCSPIYLASIPESPRLKPPATNPGGNLGVIKAATCGFANHLSHSRNRESRG